MKKKYFLLPFKFSEFGNSQEILVNLVGDFLIFEKGISKKIVENRINNDDTYKDLISNFFICENSPLKLLRILSIRYRTKKNFLEEFTSLHIFVITLRCNQNCSYCQVSSVRSTSTKYDMSLEDIEYSVQKMFNTPAQNITMEFQGGEPLLVFDNIKYAIELAENLNREYSKNIRFVICSNATLLTKEFLYYMKDHSILLSTSLDGPKQIHDLNRIHKISSSYILTKKGIELAKTFLGVDNISALMTTTKHSLKHSKDIINEYLKFGFNSIFLREINPYGLAIDSDLSIYSTEEFIDFYKECFEYILDLNKQGIFFIESYAVILLKKILTPFSSGFVDLQSPSGIINNVIVYNYDGYIYASDESRMMGEKKDYFFRLGKISDEYNDVFFNKKVKEIAKHWSNESLAGCSDCCYQIYCGADPVRNYLNFRDLEGFRPTSDFCKKNKMIFEFLIEKSLDKANYKIFQAWFQ